jgi:subtilisin family serine protease
VSDFNNQGKCVSVFAPGEQIHSGWNKGVNSQKCLSGTSFAAPHVTGAFALWMAERGESNPATLYALLDKSSTQGVLKGNLTSSNLLLYSPLNSMAAATLVQANCANSAKDFWFMLTIATLSFLY